MVIKDISNNCAKSLIRIKELDKRSHLRPQNKRISDDRRAKIKFGDINYYNVFHDNLFQQIWRLKVGPILTFLSFLGGFELFLED